MKHIKQNNYQIMPWKNGLGLTAQIDKDPNNLWRLSQATISQKSMFSEFKNCKRILTVLKGDGLKLNLKYLYLNEIYEFDGELKIDCQLLGSEVLDLGLIYDTHKIQAKMSFINFDKKLNYKINSDICLLYCAEGEFNIENEDEIKTVNANDTLKIESTSEIQLVTVETKTKIIAIEIDYLN